MADPLLTHAAMEVVRDLSSTFRRHEALRLAWSALDAEEQERFAEAWLDIVVSRMSATQKKRGARRSKTVRRSVRLVAVQPPGRGKETGAEKLFAFGLSGVAAARGVTIHAAYRAKQRGVLNPTDLRSVAQYLLPAVLSHLGRADLIGELCRKRTTISITPIDIET